MWTRIELKNKAKHMLAKPYWKAFIVMLISALLGANNSLPRLDFEYKTETGQMPDISFDFGLFTWLFPLIAGIALFVVLLAIAFKLFISNPLSVGKSRFFLDAFEKDHVEINRLSYGFKSNCISLVKVMFMRDLSILLWTFLLVIPGIVKSYAYRFVPYILAEKPNVTYDQALGLSENMTRGHKSDMFILDLSFLGWYLLGFLAFGLGTFFVHPYHEATFTARYKYPNLK